MQQSHVQSQRDEKIMGVSKELFINVSVALVVVLFIVLAWVTFASPDVVEVRKVISL